jgi:hypothetical protein
MALGLGVATFFQVCGLSIQLYVYEWHCFVLSISASMATH